MKRLSVVLILLLTAALALAACDLGGGPAPLPSAAPTGAPATTGVPTATTGGPAAPSPTKTGAPVSLAQAGAALDALPSYRWAASWMLQAGEGGATSPLSWQAEGVRVADGNRWHVTWSLGEGDVTLEVIHIGDQEWVRFGDQWVETPTDQQMQFVDFTPLGWWNDLAMGLTEHTERVSLLQGEQVNDVLCQRYRTTASYQGVLISGGTNWSHQGDVWLAVDGGYPVRGRFMGTGTIESVAWTLTQELDITHVGDPANAVNPPGS
ncbi:MAG: hypothetical protein KKA73_20755 [Chloroflexi bacterium]|nr:hypothetical protein [Chloroflexota bacterium]MBU1750122.1 hypothetical protein [Chloroflexota bacterium]